MDVLEGSVVSGSQSLVQAVQVSLGAAAWLTPADEATKALALGYAKYVDDAEMSGSGELIHKAYSVAGPNLQKTLTSLGLNPEARKELGVKGEYGEVDPIDELKNKRARKQAASG